MPRFVVLLRGVNVGKGNRVQMNEFKALLEDLGYTCVSTLINSGNAVFSSPSRDTLQHGNSISSVLKDRLAVSTPAVVKSAADMDAIVRDAPFTPAESEHSRFLVAFAPDFATLQTLEVLVALAQPPERFVVSDNAAYLYCPAGSLQSRVGAALLGRAGREVTTRNWATVLKLSALVKPSAA